MLENVFFYNARDLFVQNPKTHTPKNLLVNCDRYDKHVTIGCQKEDSVAIIIECT